LNKDFYKDLDTNFEEACKMSETEFLHEELIEMLKNGNIPQKQIAALKLDYIESAEEASLLVSNLTGCDGKIREAVALRINRFLKENPETKCFFTQAETFANASIDINANICRLVIDSVAVLNKDKTFASIYNKKIENFIDEAFAELDNFIFRDKKYVINKQLFKLYWSLEALKLFVNDIEKEKLLKILTRASIEKEYTIREKVAQIVLLSNIPCLDRIKNSLKNDENYYVRAVFEDI